MTKTSIAPDRHVLRFGHWCFRLRHHRESFFHPLRTLDDVPIKPAYEYSPIDSQTLHRFLSDRGHGVKLVNLSTLSLSSPSEVEVTTVIVGGNK